MAERHSEYQRDEYDFYCESPHEVKQLIELTAVRYWQGRSIHDPCCGKGTIPDTAMRRGIASTGSDLVDRANGRFQVQDFLKDTQEYANICTNPPFKIAPKIIIHALEHVPVGGRVAALVQAKFLFGQRRYHELYNRPEVEHVIIFSKRPNMPPGKMLEEFGEECRGGGAIDFTWVIWRRGKETRHTTIEWTL